MGATTSQDFGAFRPVLKWARSRGEWNAAGLAGLAVGLRPSEPGFRRVAMHYAASDTLRTARCKRVRCGVRSEDRCRRPFPFSSQRGAWDQLFLTLDRYFRNR